jgi:hypothetical protein
MVGMGVMVRGGCLGCGTFSRSIGSTATLVLCDLCVAAVGCGFNRTFRPDMATPMTPRKWPPTQSFKFHAELP